MRSAKAPLISAGVMIANFSWKSANRSSGTVGESASCGADALTLEKKAYVRGAPMMRRCCHRTTG